MAKIKQLLDDTIKGMPNKEKLYPVTVGEAVYTADVKGDRMPLNNALGFKAGYYITTIEPSDTDPDTNCYYMYSFADYLSYQLWYQYKDRNNEEIVQATQGKFNKAAIEALCIARTSLHETEEAAININGAAFCLSRNNGSNVWTLLRGHEQEAFNTIPAVINPFIPEEAKEQFLKYSKMGIKLKISSVSKTDDNSVDGGLVIGKAVNGGTSSEYIINGTGVTMEQFLNMYGEGKSGIGNFSTESMNFIVKPKNTLDSTVKSYMGAIRVEQIVESGESPIILPMVYYIKFTLNSFSILSPDLDTNYTLGGKDNPNYFKTFSFKTANAVSDVTLSVPELSKIFLIKGSYSATNPDQFKKSVTLTSTEANAGVSFIVINHNTTELPIVEEDEDFAIQIYHGNTLVGQMNWTLKSTEGNPNATRYLRLKIAEDEANTPYYYKDDTDNCLCKRFQIQVHNVDVSVDAQPIPMTFWCRLYNNGDVIEPSEGDAGVAPSEMDVYNENKRGDGYENYCVHSASGVKGIGLASSNFFGKKGDADTTNMYCWIDVIITPQQAQQKDFLYVHVDYEKDGVKLSSVDVTNSIDKVNINRIDEDNPGGTVVVGDDSDNSAGFFERLSTLILNEGYVDPKNNFLTHGQIDTVTRLESSFNANDNEIVELDLSDFTNLTEIGDYAFSNCVNLKRLILPDSVTSIGKGLCSGCTNLEYVYLGSGVSEILNKSFDGCPALSDLYLPFIGTGVDATTQQEMQYGVMCIMDLDGTNKFFDDNIDLTVHVHEDLVEAYPTAWSTLVTQYGDNLTFVAIEDNTDA